MQPSTAAAFSAQDLWAAAGGWAGWLEAPRG